MIPHVAHSRGNRPALAVSLYVSGKTCVVVGDGDLADERAARLASAGAVVHRVTGAGFGDDSLEGVFLVMICDAAASAAVSSAAHARGILVYVLDQPDLSDLAMPAIATRGPLTLAVSTDGDAPALARQLRAELQRLLDESGPDLDALLEEMARLRRELAPGTRRGPLSALAERLSITGSLAVR